jgi:hypothetical protein
LPDRIDFDRDCELCGGPIMVSNEINVCRTTPECMLENDKRRNRTTGYRCKVCGSAITKRNKIGICRTKAKCRAAAKREHDHRYHLAHKDEKDDDQKLGKQRAHRQTVLLPEDGIVDEIAVYLAVNGIRKVAMTHRERVEATRQMLLHGASIREMCDHLHVQPRIVRDILDELGFECVRNEHIAGSKIMIILPKNRARGPKILDDDKPAKPAKKKVKKKRGSKESKT